jgi:hypothetical protein
MSADTVNKFITSPQPQSQDSPLTSNVERAFGALILLVDCRREFVTG